MNTQDRLIENLLGQIDELKEVNKGFIKSMIIPEQNFGNSKVCGGCNKLNQNCICNTDGEVTITLDKSQVHDLNYLGSLYQEDGVFEHDKIVRMAKLLRDIRRQLN